MKRLQTHYGELEGVTSHKTYASGSLKSCTLNRSNTLETAIGPIIPQFREAPFGERQKKHCHSLTFYPSGQIKNAALDQSTPIETCLGTVNAEMVTFYEDGRLNRLFPLNGRIDGFWTEKDEQTMAESLSFDLPMGTFEAKVISLRFYPSGKLRAVTLWPGEKIKLQTPAGEMRVGSGFSLYEDGSLCSVEPARPTKIQTPIGEILAFDTEIIGMHADQNSVQFSPSGELLSLKTVNSGIRYFDKQKGTIGRLEPLEAPSLIDINETRTIPMQIEFKGDEIRCSTPETIVFCRNSYQLIAYKRTACVSSGCASCSGCASAPAERSANVSCCSA